LPNAQEFGIAGAARRGGSAKAFQPVLALVTGAIPHYMKGYLDLVRNVLENGEERPDRTGVGTISLFGAQVRYDMREGFPLLTTKKVLFDAVVHELLWFLRGSTNINEDLLSTHPFGMRGPMKKGSWGRSMVISGAIGAAPASIRFER